MNIYLITAVKLKVYRESAGQVLVWAVFLACPWLLDTESSCRERKEYSRPYLLLPGSNPVTFRPEHSPVHQTTIVAFAEVNFPHTHDQSTTDASREA